MSWIERMLAPHVQRDMVTSDGRTMSVRAYPRGIPPRSRHLVSVTPYFFGLGDLVAFVRYRTKFRGAWVVEVRERSYERVVAESVVPSRSAAMDELVLAASTASIRPIVD